MRVAGFLFLAIIVLNFASVSFGNELMSDLDVEDKLRRISENQSKFKTGVFLSVAEHVAIILLAGTLFVAFSQYDRTLGWVWLGARFVEGLILLYSEVLVWGLLDLSEKYSVSNVGQSGIVESGLSILLAKNTGFLFASVLFGVGTMAYSYVFVTNALVPLNIGRFGLVCGFLWGFSNGISLFSSSFLALTNFSGLLVLIFESVLGGWLPLFSNSIT